MRDFIVIGGGIAGLAVAELLQRSGRSVLLLEAAPALCSNASAQQQGWFHSGALYAALPSARYFRQLVGNLDDVLNYYGAYPGANLTSGRHLVTPRLDGWFRNGLCYYFYASPRDRTIPFFTRLPWRLATIRAKSRLSWFETIDFSRELSPQVGTFNASLNLKRCQVSRAFEFDPGPTSCVLRSRDRTVDATRLMRDLARAFVAAGGEVRTNARVLGVDRTRVVLEGGEARCRHVIVSAGHEVSRLTSLETRVVKSPLLVVKPALTDVNFIRMTPVMRETFNHLVHPSPEGDYSLIGNAVYYDADADVDESEVKAGMLDRARKIFGTEANLEKTALYFGTKTEVVGVRQLRNYQYHIVDTENAVVALPGKMTLAFSLAVNLCKHFGVDPVAEVVPGDQGGRYVPVEEPLHYQEQQRLT